MKKLKLIIGVTGLARSGKDTVARIIASELGVKKYNFSDLLRAQLEREGREVSKNAMTKLAEKMREKHGSDVMAKELLKRVRESEIVVSGVRTMSDVQVLTENSERFALVKVSASREARFGRGSKEDSKEFQEFFERDKFDLEHQGMQEVLDVAGYEVVNEAGLKELTEKTLQITKEITKER